MRSLLMLTFVSLLLSSPLPADEAAFTGEVAFTIDRKGAEKDVQDDTEQRIADLFQKLMGKKTDVKISTMAKSGGVHVSVESSTIDAAAAFKKASTDALSLKSPFPIRLEYKRMKLRRRETPTPRKEVPGGENWEGDWKEAWEKSMERMERKLNQSLRTGLQRALGHLERVGDEIDRWEPFPENGQNPGASSRHRAGRPRTPNRPARALGRGAFELSVNEETKRITRLVAYDAELGAIMTNLAARLPMNYIFSDDRIPRLRVTLSLVDCEAGGLVDALAASAGVKLRRQGKIVYFEGK